MAHIKKPCPSQFECQCFEPLNYCSCKDNLHASDVLLENVKKVAETLVEVMIVCNVAAWKAKRAKDVIIHVFLHFDEIRVRVDAIPKKRLCKEDLFHDLHRKCCMTRMESQMVYSIVKRAFRAFYHGTAEGGIPYQLYAEQLVHKPECFWRHASIKTAKIFAIYEGLFMVSQKEVESKIRELYKDLFDRIKPMDEDGNHECTCDKCVKRMMRDSLKIVKVTTRLLDVTDPYEAHYLDIVNKMLDYRDEESNNSADSRICTCPQFKKPKNTFIYHEMAKVCATGYSQGPFDCHWAPINKEEYDADDAVPMLELPQEYPCPPCESDDNSLVSSCDSQCVCTCEECTCQSDKVKCSEEDTFEYDVTYSGELAEEELLNEFVSEESHESDHRTEFSLKYSGCKNPSETLEMTMLHFKSKHSFETQSSDLELNDQNIADPKINTDLHNEKVETS